MVNFLQNFDLLFKFLAISDLGMANCLTRPYLLGNLVPDSVDHAVCATAQNIFLVHLVTFGNSVWIVDNHRMLFNDKTFLF
jgi:hypothetical protein